MDAASGDAGKARAARAKALGIPVLRLSVAPQHVAKLDAKRQQAIRDGILCTEEGDFVPGWAQLAGHATRIDLRLKGDWIDHLADSSWSLRLKTRGDAILFGMRKFSLHAVGCRGGPGELMLLDEMREAGILAPRSFPVHVRLNDRDFGVMVVEEHFGKELIEAGRKREGVVVAFDEDVFWRQRREYRRKIGAHGRNIVRYEGTYFDDASSMALRVLDEKRIWRSPALRARAETAIGLLRGLLEGRLDAASVFDLRLWARHRCLASVWGSTHGLASHNLRMYFNAITRRFEPIAFDNHTAAANVHEPVAWALCELVRGFAQPEFRAECQRFATQYAAELAGGRGAALNGKAADTFAQFAELGDGHEMLHTAELLSRCRRLLAMPLPDEPVRNFSDARPGTFAEGVDAIALLKAYWLDSDGAGVLELVNPLQREVVVEEVSWHSGRQLAVMPRIKNAVVAASMHRQKVTRIAVPWSPLGGGRLELLCRSSDTGSSRVRQQAHRSWPILQNAPLAAPTAEQVANSHVGVDLEAGQLVIRTGRWTFEHDLITPLGVAVRIEAGAHLAFAQQARLVVRGPLQIAGVAGDPVRMKPIDTSWPGLVVLGDDCNVDINYLVVAATARHLGDTWGITGGVTLHRTRATLRNCRFQNNRCEDALNLVDSEFELRDCQFLHAESDAIDGDFSSGRIVGCRFETVGGDAIDVSGSNLELASLVIRDVRDKAVSIGERSTCTARDLNIDRVGVAVAAKDGSRATLQKCTIHAARLAALMAYVKKPVFGYAKIEARQLTIAADVVAARSQHGSSIAIDGEAIASEAIDVHGLYQGLMRKAQ